MEHDYDIIAVDDDTLEHEIMTRALRKTSYQIKCFEYADEAFDCLAVQLPRYLFVDYRMPDCNALISGSTGTRSKLSNSSVRFPGTNV